MLKPYVWLWLLTVQLLLLLPNRWKVPPRCQEGSTQRCDTLRNAHILLFPPFVVQPLPVHLLYYLNSRVLLTIVCKIIVILPNHDTAAKLPYLCKPRADLFFRLPCTAARVLQAGGGTRNALLQRRLWSAIFRSTLCVEPDVALGIKCEYNRARISRLYLASDSSDDPLPPQIARHCDPQRLRIFPSPRLCSLQPSKYFCSPYLMMHTGISQTKIFNSTTQAASTLNCPTVSARFFSRKYNMHCVPKVQSLQFSSYTD